MERRNELFSEFSELQLTRRWRVRTEQVTPIRVEAPPEPPEDPLAEATAGAGEGEGQENAGEAAGSSGGSETGGGEDAVAAADGTPATPPSPGSFRRPSLRLRVGAGRWRDALRRFVSTFVEDDEADELDGDGEALAGVSGRAMGDVPSAAHDARPPAPEDTGQGEPGHGPSPAPTPRLPAESELVVFVGALPRCGTTTALAGWALARAEGGEDVVVIDAHSERPFLPVHLMGRVARQGWMDARRGGAARPVRYIVPVPGAECLRLMPLAWHPALEPPASHDIAARLPVAVEAAQRAGATAVAVDLGTFRPLCGPTVDARLQWAAREAGLLAVVAPNDVLGIDAAARMVVAARAEGARKVVLMLVGGDTRVATAYQVQRMLASLEPPAVVDAVVPVPWEDAIQRALGRELTPLRVGALLPEKRRRGVA